MAALPTRWMILVNTSSLGACSTVSGHLENSGSFQVNVPSLRVSTVACCSSSARLKPEGMSAFGSTDTIT